MLPGKGPLLRVGRHRMLQIFSHGEEVLNRCSTLTLRTLCCSRVEAAISGGCVSSDPHLFMYSALSVQPPTHGSTGFIDFDVSCTAPHVLLRVRFQSPINVGRSEKTKQAHFLLCCNSGKAAGKNRNGCCQEILSAVGLVLLSST